MLRITCGVMGALAIALLAVPAHGTVVVGDWTIVDNSFGDDAGGTFSLVGTWGGGMGEPNQGGGAGNGLYNAAGNGGDSATWNFLNLPNGTYDVAVSYATPHSNRATNSPYSINGGTPFTVNQETVAAGTPTLNDGSADIPFDLLTTTALVDSGTLSVVLTDNANEFVIADAVAIRLNQAATTETVPEPVSIATWSILGICLAGYGYRRRRRNS